MIVVLQHWSLCLGLPAAFCESVKILIDMGWMDGWMLGRLDAWMIVG